MKPDNLKKKEYKTLNMWKFGVMAIIVTMGIGAIELRAQTASADSITVPLTDSSKTVFLNVDVPSGNIIVHGWARNDVFVQSQMRIAPTDTLKPLKSKALRLYPDTSSFLWVREDTNVITVTAGAETSAHAFDITIDVPSECSMELKTAKDGKIAVDSAIGDLEVTNTNGSVEMTDITGSADVEAPNGDITATFLGVDSQKTMAFSSISGKIDVTLPQDVRAWVTMKTAQGSIYCDFDVQAATMKPHMGRRGSRMRRGGAGMAPTRVKLRNSKEGTINGGGAEMTFTNFNGDIYLRKAH
jgi:DUF4097 and DUF4098 domain-containing protein YvlB